MLVTLYGQRVKMFVVMSLLLIFQCLLACLFEFFGSNKKQKLVNPRIPQPRYLPQNSQRDTSVLCVDILF